MKEEEQFFYDESYDAAVKKYEDMIKNNKRYFFDVEEFEDIIDYYLDNNEHTHAEHAVNIAIQQHPNSTAIQLKNAQLLIDQGKPFHALKILNKIEQIESNDPDIYILKAYAQNLLGNIKETVRQFDIALTVIAEDEKEELLHHIAVSLMNMLHYKLAIKFLKQAHLLNPSNLSVIYDLGLCFEKNNDFKKCLLFYNKYLDINPYAEMVWYKIGGVYEKLEKFDKAIEAYDFAIAIDNDYTLVYLSKANVLIQKRLFQEAINAYTEFLEHEPEYVEAYCNIGICYEELGSTEKALDNYFKAIEIDNQYSEPYFLIGNLEINLGNYKSSIPFLEKAVELDEGNDEYWITLAEVYSILNKYSKATNAYDKAIDLEPYIFSYWLSYAEYCYLKKKRTKAIKILLEANLYNPDVPEINYHLAAYYFEENDMESVLFYFEKGLEDDFMLHKPIVKKFPALLKSALIKKLINQYK